MTESAWNDDVSAGTPTPGRGPTLAAQAIGALVSLGLITTYTRVMEPAAFGAYAALLAAYAIANAFVGASIGTRCIAELATGRADRLQLDLRRDGAPLAGCLLLAGTIAQLLIGDLPTVGLATVGMASVLIVELANAFLLGTDRQRGYAILTAARMMIWLLGAIAAVAIWPDANLLNIALVVMIASATVTVPVVLRSQRIELVSRGDSGDSPSQLWVGAMSLGLWTIAAGDRIVLGAVSLEDLAPYAALYGLMDRVFRTVLNAEIHWRLPGAFRTHGVAGTDRAHNTSALLAVGVACFSVVLGVAGPTVVRFVSDGRYEPALWISLVLSTALTFMLWAGPTQVRLVAAGRTRLLATIALGCAVLNLGGNLLLAPHFGVRSAAVLALASYLAWFLALRLTVLDDHPARQAPPAREPGTGR